MSTGPHQVEILHISSPHCIYVRLCSIKDLFCEVQESLANTYSEKNSLLQYSLPSGEHPKLGQSYAVRMPSAWYRGVLINNTKNMDKFLVRLVDAGRIAEVHISALFKLAPDFLSLNACSFRVHLSQLPYSTQKNKDEVKHMEELLRNQEVVKLLRRAPPRKIDGDWSLPAEISWVEFEDVDPFLPSIKREVFLSQRLLSKNNNLVETEALEDTFELDDDDVNDSDVVQTIESLQLENNKKPDDPDRASNFATLETSEKSSFKWLSPELPVKRHFYARATFVDDSGQIYMHLHDQRHQFRTLRTNLNNHFSKSLPDCSKDSYVPYQEVVAKFVDNTWYRARFLGYVPDSEYEQSYVLFVDWGNTCIVDTSLMRSNIIELDKPILAFRAVLHNVLPDRRSWTPDTIDFITNKVLYTNNEGKNSIKVQVESGLDRQPLLVSIELYSPLDPGDSRKEVFTPWIDISELLVKKNEARYVNSSELDSEDQRRNRKSYDYGIGFTVMKRRKDKKRANKEENNPQSANVSQQIPRLDINCMNLSPGSVIKCKLAAVDSWDKVFIHLLNEDKRRGVVDIYSSFSSVDRCMQAKCRDMPPVITPREGLIVALWRGKGEGGWCRAEISRCEETGYLVRVVDWGVEQWVSDSRVIRQLPDECLGVPVQAVPLHLSIRALEDHDALFALLTECLLSAEDMEMVVKVTSCEGTLFGHLLDKENNQPLYKRLEKEKLLEIL